MRFRRLPTILFQSTERLRRGLLWVACVTWYPTSLDMLNFRNILSPHHESTHINLYRQILSGITSARSSQIILAKHDVLCPSGEAMLANLAGGICYNKNTWWLNPRGSFRAADYDFLSNCGGPAEC